MSAEPVHHDCGPKPQNLTSGRCDRWHQNVALFGEWVGTHGTLANEAAGNLQPVWSLPRVKAAQYTDALEQAHNRLRAIGAAVGFDVRSVTG